MSKRKSLFWFTIRNHAKGVSEVELEERGRTNWVLRIDGEPYSFRSRESDPLTLLQIGLQVRSDQLGP